MKQFFKDLFTTIKTLFSGRASKHQRNITIGTLIFGLILNFIFGFVSTVLFMYIFALLAELIYCFVPTRSLVFNTICIHIPDFEEFKKNIEKYLLQPKHNFDIHNIFYILIGIFLFIILKLIFLFF